MPCSNQNIQICAVKDIRLLRPRQPSGSFGNDTLVSSAFVGFEDHSVAKQAARELGNRVEDLKVHGFGDNIVVELAEEGLQGRSRRSNHASSATGGNAEQLMAAVGWEPTAFEEQEADDRGRSMLDKGHVDRSVDESRPTTDEEPAAEQGGFVHDPGSGYMYDARSGYYYDSQTGLYCHPSVGSWGTLDFATGVFTPYQAGEKPAPQPDMPPEQRKRQSAVIGAAPVLDAQALLEAARRADEAVSMQSPDPRPPAVSRQPATTGAAVSQSVQGVVHRGKWAQRVSLNNQPSRP